MINGLTVAILFSLSFFTMWLIARRFNSGTKLGYSPYLFVGIVLTVIAGFFMTMFAATLLIGLVKFLILGFIVLAAGLVELSIWSHEKNILADHPGSFLKIPNYAEIAKKVGNPSSILDIGCSEGFFLGDVTISGLKVGIEKDLDSLIAGRSERSNVNFVCADASNLPFCQNSFETVVMIGVMPYLDKPREVLLEVHRILTHQGQVEISTASVQWFYRYLNIYNWKYKFHFYSSAELETILNTTGFNVKSIVTRGRFIAPLLSNLFIIPNLIDRLAGNTRSVLGPCARLARVLTNPLIQWEYDHHRGIGYQIFVSGDRNG
jgi:SAM-dependent methyltransferase